MDRLGDDTVVKSQDVVDYLVRDGGEPVGSAVDAAMAHFRREAGKYARIVTAGDLRAD